LSILHKIIQQLIEDFTDGLKHDFEGYADRILRRVLRILVLGGMGVTFLAAGSIFILIGIVTYISQFISTGLAWGLVGLIVVSVGGVLLLLIRR
jgi:hypothetical protein